MIKPRKSLGQNFLIDRSVGERIVTAVSPQPDDLIIEIGPGTGALTGLLAARAGYVVAIELDTRLADQLKASLSADNVLVMNADVLDISWKPMSTMSAVRDRGPKAHRSRVVANLPYYISTAIITDLLTSRAPFFDLTLMLQKEVVDRIISKPGVGDYGYLSVLVQFYTEAVKLFEVPPEAFKPAPKVESAVVRLSVRKRPAVEVADEAEFLKLVSAAFAQRRKTILNCLAAPKDQGDKKQVEEILHRAGIDPRRRGETLSLVEFAALDKEWQKRQKRP